MTDEEQKTKRHEALTKLTQMSQDMGLYDTPEDRIVRVLDKGFVRLVDSMGNDSSIVQAARVSYGEGTKKVSEDEGLIRYLLRHRHTTPMEMVQFKFHVKAPIFVIRQWHRHRTWCLSGDTELWYDSPSSIREGTKGRNKITIADFYDKWHHGAKPITTQDGIIMRMPLKKYLEKRSFRCLNEENKTIEHTNITDVWKSGIKHIFEIELENGYKIKTSQDHLFYTENGWKKLKEFVGIKNTDIVYWDDISLYTNGQSVNSSYFEKGSIPWNNNIKIPPEEKKAKCHRGHHLVGKLSKIKKVSYVGQEYTYDISVSGSFHNFIANGFVVHNSYNEESGRYSEMKNEYYVPDPSKVTFQNPNNKQGGTDDIITPFNIKNPDDWWDCLTPEQIASTWNWQKYFEDEQKLTRHNYERYLNSGMRKELARINLPLAQYSQMYGCVDLHNLFHFLKLRQDPHAQYEIRVYADALLQLIQPIVPVAVKAYEDYILNSVTLTGKDIEALKDALRSVDESLFFGSAIGSAANTVFSNKREKDEFLAKIQRLKHI